MHMVAFANLFSPDTARQAVKAVGRIALSVSWDAPADADSDKTAMCRVAGCWPCA
jgi:hypothetical protein